MKIGILGGTFNPIHNSHLYLAENYQKALELDLVIFMPTAIPPHKTVLDLASGEDRVAMCKLAVKPFSVFVVSSYEVEKAGVSYTYETLEYLENVYHGAELYLLMGSDMFLSLLEWRHPEEIIKRAVLATLPREEKELLALKNQKEVLQAQGATCIILDVAPQPLSSTMIRETIRQGYSVEEYLPIEVYRYILAHNLYGTGKRKS